MVAWSCAERDAREHNDQHDRAEPFGDETE
jgi:hypothetical protein